MKEIVVTINKKKRRKKPTEKMRHREENDDERKSQQDRGRERERRILDEGNGSQHANGTCCIRVFIFMCAFFWWVWKSIDRFLWKPAYCTARNKCVSVSYGLNCLVFSIKISSLHCKRSEFHKKKKTFEKVLFGMEIYRDEIFRAIDIFFQALLIYSK